MTIKPRIVLARLLSAILLSGGTVTGGTDTVRTVDISVSMSAGRQVIDGFGGSLAFWGYDADETSLRYALKDLGATIVRFQGEVSPSGNDTDYMNVLQRAARISPGTRFLATFWQPRSKDKLSKEDWLDKDTSGAYFLKPAMKEAWANEIVSRITTFTRDWGINVSAIGVQNEANWSIPGTQTCKWQPDELGQFISKYLSPRMASAGLKCQLGIPDLAYIGHEASEAKSFFPAFKAMDNAVFLYHMYDSYKHGDTDNIGFPTFRERQKALGQAFTGGFPGRRIWMTETSGATWNNSIWHPLGWTPDMDEHDKAIAAARYIHSALVDAGCSAFLWWGLVYSEPPPHIKGEHERQKFRDEGLILVAHEKKNGVHPFLERTKKYYIFKQFSRFVPPGCLRVDAPSTDACLVTAFRSPDSSRLVIVLINPAKNCRIKPQISMVPDCRITETWVTDRTRQCEKVQWTGSLEPESVTTLICTPSKP